MNKVALVIGGSGGIGSEVVKSMIKEDIKVYSTYYTEKDLENKGAKQYQMDLTDKISINNAFKNILAEDKKIDIIVFSATPPIKNKPILNVEWEDIKKHIEVQTKGLFEIVQNLKEQIKSKHKTKFIVILTEYCIGAPPSEVSHYVIAKYSLMGLAKSMAVELAKYNSTINMVSPGMVNTNLISNLPAKLIEITAEKNPLKRIATPKDVANVVQFLSSDASDYLNGTNITVNGGGIML